MCIIADIVKHVDNTKIAVFHVGYKMGLAGEILPGQLIVYSANVDSTTDQNAFILPVYNLSKKTNLIIPLDMSDLSDFFTVLDNIYDRWFPPKRIQSTNFFNTESYSLQQSNFLPVHTVGDYKFSIVPHKSDFLRIDSAQLHVNPSAKTSIDVHSDDYSFIVYQFYQKGKINITPFGYICPQYALPNTLFVPTIHGHPHEMFSPAVYAHIKSGFEQTASYDHVIYAIVKCNPDQNQNQNQNQIIPKKNDIIDLDHLVRNIKTDYLDRNIQICVPKCFIPKKITITNSEPNRNFIIDASTSKFVYDLVLDGRNLKIGSNPHLSQHWYQPK